MITLRNAFDLARITARKWDEHNAPRLSASLAYYTLLSLAPVVVLVLAIYGLAFSRTVAEQELLNQARSFVGPTGVNTIKTVVDTIHGTSGGILAAFIAAIMLLVGASSVVEELRSSLNAIWDVPAGHSTVKSLLWRRMVSFALVLSLGLLLLASLLLGALITFLEDFARNILPDRSAQLGQIANHSLSFLTTIALFALIFRFVPDRRVAWRAIAVGAAATALLFTAGRGLLGLYLTKAAVGSAYGAAGSLVAFVVWIYYSAQIFFFGATLTSVCSAPLKPAASPTASSASTQG